jgi:hypothetical protein
MVSRLSILRSRLARLRRVRGLLRIASGMLALLASVGLALYIVFLTDWVFRLTIVERAVVMTLAAAGVFWAYVRLAHPLLWGRRESEVETALFVQRQHDIDSDLVAALQFADTQRPLLGSAQLAEAVVDYVGRAAPSIDVFQGLSVTQLFRRLAGVMAVLAVAVGLAVAAPGHVAAFANRLLFGAQPYPTRTQIEQIIVGRTVVYSSANDDQQLADVKAPEGQPLRFTVVCAGALPASASVQVEPRGQASSGTRIELKPDSPRSNTYSGRLPRLVEDATYRLRVGDAETAAARIQMIPLPMVELQLVERPPAYTGLEKTSLDPAARTASILAGSSIELAIAGTNHKPLKSVFVELQTAAESERIELEPLDPDRLRWSAPDDCPALTDIRSDRRYEVQVVDDDDLAPQVPLRGVIRVRPDLPPSAALELVHRVVLPTARPVVTFRATDDYGIVKAELIVDVERGTASAESAAAADSLAAVEADRSDGPRPVESHHFSLPLAAQPLVGDQLPMASTYHLELEPLALAPGDRLRLVVAITDYRGQPVGQPGGEQAMSDARILEIAGENDVLAAIREADQRSEVQLNELIRRQLGIGEQP